MDTKDSNLKDDIENRTARHLFVLQQSVEETNNLPGETPESIYRVYRYNKCVPGAGVVAIVGAFNYPTALADFNIFSRQFGLPIETSTNALAATNKVFQVINARGVAPALDAGWAMESALDVQWAHAMAPGSKIVLVQAASNTFVDLFQAVDVANAIPNVVSISMSWGGYEWAGEMAFDAHLKQPGVIYVAGSGDIGGQTLYPSVSQYVLSVGGTRINRDMCGRFVSETGWASGGGGPSIFVPVPASQESNPSAAAKVGRFRGTPDVSFVADPATGVLIYDSTPYNGFSGWSVIGGTSLAAPCWAGIVSCINSMRKNKIASTEEFLAYIYSLTSIISYTSPCSCFRDITTGTAGTFSATVGWDFVTGLGTPNIRNLICVLENH